ncbi:MAG: S1 RNA-binding domain-containing protein [Acidobacteria bacterium]|nr:S1 RNA-binding domain-containing protein [Acidobacteriota bacterium]
MSEQDEDFAALFEASLKAKPVAKGQVVEGTIVKIGAEVALVDVGGKSEAVIDTAELKDDHGALDVEVGDRIQATVISTSGGVTLSRKLARRAATDRQIEDAYHAGLPVEGAVQGVNKGGYEIRIGHSRAFCPLSQIDSARTMDPAVHVGQRYTFRIVEYTDGGRNIVVSRRALLEEAQQARADEVRLAVVPGAILRGRVVSVPAFGAFVDLGGGVQGLVHISEMGWSRATDASEVVSPGDEVTVKVLRVDEATGRIALSLKQATDDPWATVPERYETGQVHTGRVTRVADFGAFVELEPGVEALAHASTFPPTGRRDGWAQSVPVGTTAAFEVLSVEPDKRRIGVALVPDGSTRAAGAIGASEDIVPGARLTGTIDRHERFGVFVFLAPGRVGLMPIEETGVDRDADLARVLPAGSAIEVIVQEVDPANRRIRLSRKAVFEAQEQAEVREYAARQDAPPSERLGSLADKLKGAWGRR